MNALLGVFLATLLRRPMTWILLVVLAAYMALIAVSFIVLLSFPVEQGGAELLLQPMREGGLAYTATLFSGIASILMIILVAGDIGPEFSRGTFRTLLVAGADRGRFTLAKATLPVILAIPVAVLGVAVTYVMAWAFGAAAGESFLPQEPWRSVPSVFVRILAVIALWGVFAAVVALLTRSMIAAIGGTLAVQIVGDVVTGMIAALGELGETAARLLPNSLVGRLAFGDLLTWRPADLWYLLDVALYVAVPLWWAVRRIRRLDAMAATRG